MRVRSPVTLERLQRLRRPPRASGRYTEQVLWTSETILSAATDLDAFYALWGLASGEVFALGATQENGFNFDPYLYEWDGSAWSAVPSFPATTLFVEPCCLWGSGSTDLWAGGEGFLYRFDGTAWGNALPAGALGVRAIWGSSATDVWIAQRTSTNLHRWDETSWTAYALPKQIVDLWGTAPDDVWAIAEDDIYHWDGSSWSDLSNPGLSNIKFVGGTSGSDVFAFGSSGGMALFAGSFIPSLKPARFSSPTDSWTSPTGRLWIVSGSGVVFHE